MPFCLLTPKLITFFGRFWPFIEDSKDIRNFFPKILLRLTNSKLTGKLSDWDGIAYTHIYTTTTKGHFRAQRPGLRLRRSEARKAKEWPFRYESFRWSKIFEREKDQTGFPSNNITNLWEETSYEKGQKKADAARKMSPILVPLVGKKAKGYFPNYLLTLANHRYLIYQRQVSHLMVPRNI